MIRIFIKTGPEILKSHRQKNSQFSKNRKNAAQQFKANALIDKTIINEEN